MKFLTTLASIGASFFTGKSSKTKEDGIALANRAADGIDKMFYTAEEKEDTKIEHIKLKQKTGELVCKFVEMTNGENSLRSMTRRYIACGIIGMDIFLTFLYIFVSAIAVHIPAYKTLVTVIKEALLYWATPTTTIIVFYFGYYAIANVVGKFTDNKNETKTNNGG